MRGVLSTWNEVFNVAFRKVVSLIYLKLWRVGAMRVAIIADDLTGATDSGVQFTRAGYRVAMVFRGSSMPPAEAADVVVVDTDSRSLSPDRARERVREAGRNFGESWIFFKKVDSTLRGPFSTEVAAALRESGRKKAVVAPAFPESGRTTVNGVQMVHGVPVHETEFADDPRTPVREGHIPSLLTSAGLRAGSVLGVESFDEPGLIRAALDVPEHECLVADAETGDHLKSLVKAIPDPSEVLWVGSAGLALAIGESYPGPGFESDISGELACRVLAVVGSMSGVVAEQRRRLSEEPGVTEVVLELPPDAGAIERALQSARAALGGGERVVLYPGEGTATDGIAERIVEGLAEVVRSLSEEDFFDALVLTGGDTAVNVARAVGAEGIMLEDEIEPGVPAGTLIGPRPYRVVTKAGGFGDRDTLHHAVRFLMGEKERTL